MTVLYVAMPHTDKFTEFKSGLFGSEFLSSMNLGTWECRQMPKFRDNEYLNKLGKEYLNDLLCNFGPFCLQHFKTFDISRLFTGNRR